MKERHISRRNFLKLAGVSALGIFSAKIGEKIFSEGKNVTGAQATFPTPEARSRPTQHPTATPELGTEAARTSQEIQETEFLSPEERREFRSRPTQHPTAKPESGTGAARTTQEIREAELPLAPIYRHGDRSQPYIALTIDDAWSPDNVRRVLDIAKERQVKLTFFPAGMMIDKSPALWQQAFQEGHEIENHTYSHAVLTELSPEEILQQIDTAQAALDRALGFHQPMHFLRPPKMGGFTTPDGVKWVRETIAKRGLGVALWDVDSYWGAIKGGGGSQEVMNYVAGSVQNGSIVLQHFTPADVGAFPAILDIVERRGLRPVTLAELLQRSGYI